MKKTVRKFRIMIEKKKNNTDNYSKLNIMYIAHERKMGGASLCLLTLAKEMKEKGHHVCVVVPFLKSPIAEKLREAGIKTIGIFFGWWMMPSYWGGLLKMAFRFLYMMEGIAVWRISHYIRKKKIDIVHSNSSVIDVGSKAAARSGVPHVWHFREFGDLDYRLMFLKGRGKSIQYLNNSDDVNIFISKCLRQHYRELRNGKRNQVIYDGVSDDYLNLRQDNLEGEPTFLISGNLQRNKRQDVVLKAVKLLKNRGMTNFKVIIAGGIASTRDSQKYAKELELFIAQNNLDNVELAGFVSDMNALRRRSDVEIVASTMEAFGRVTVEAMLSGNPVLAADSGANGELIEDGRTGWLFETGNEYALADKMFMIIENKNAIRTIGKNAFDVAVLKYLSYRNTQEIENLYMRIMKEKKEKSENSGTQTGSCSGKL